MKKNTLAFAAFCLAGLLSLAACNNAGGGDGKLPFNYDPDYSYIDGSKINGKKIKVGAVLIGDSTEGYSAAHINGIKAAKDELEKFGATIEISWKEKVSDEDLALTKTAINDLIADKNDIIVTNSYGHQNAYGTGDGAINPGSHPSIDFLAMTGDTACVLKQNNYHNAFNSTYQSRYVSGVVAGLKLKELVEDNLIKDSNKDKDGNIKLGYVGAHPFAEVVSGYTAFYLGVKSIVNNVSMDVKYVNSWWDHDKEKVAAKELINQGAVIVSQHADSTGTPEATEEAFNEGKVVYNVGYNVSMIEAAPNTSLTSATNNWAVYYTHAFYNRLCGQAIERDWCAGYEAGANAITAINYGCFKTNQSEIDEKICDVSKKLHDDELKVFDTSKFTVGGKHITEYTITDDWSTVKGTQCIKTVGGVSFFDESNTSVRSAPYFDVRIDNIREPQD